MGLVDFHVSSKGNEPGDDDDEEYENLEDAEEVLEAQAPLQR